MIQIVWINNNSSGLTGTTSETKVASFEIPANTVGANDLMEITLTTTKTGVAGQILNRVYFNTSDAIGGQQAVQISSNGANLWNSCIRRGICKNATNAQVWISLNQGTTYDDTIAGVSAKLSTTVDFTLTQWVVVSLHPGSAADTTTLESVTLKIYRQ